MNNLNLEQQQNKTIYRELFLKAHEDLKKQINHLKCGYLCKKDGTCRKIRYTDLSPADIYILNQREKIISEEYIKLLVPYGSDENFDYESNNYIDIEENNRLAKEIDADYVALILKKFDYPVYFYYFKEVDSENCKHSKLLSNFPQSVTTILPKDCKFREWQKAVLKTLQEEVSKDIKEKLDEIDRYRDNFHCKKTGTCCKIACSEFSYEELKEKAQNGDNFATQFTSIFIPYESDEEARKIFPEYYDLVKEQLGEEENVYFYHCPHITEDNLCSRYEQRPDICRDFPNNPLSILPSCCGFHQWKEEVHIQSMLLHALIMLTEFYIEKLEKAIY